MPGDDPDGSRRATRLPSRFPVSSSDRSTARLRVLLRARRSEQLRVRSARAATAVALVNRHDRHDHLGVVCRHVRRRDERGHTVGSHRPQASARRHHAVVLVDVAAERVGLERPKPVCRAAADRSRIVRDDRRGDDVHRRDVSVPRPRRVPGAHPDVRPDWNSRNGVRRALHGAAGGLGVARRLRVGIAGGLLPPFRAAPGRITALAGTPRPSR